MQEEENTLTLTDILVFKAEVIIIPHRPPDKRGYLGYFKDLVAYFLTTYVLKE